MDILIYNGHGTTRVDVLISSIVAMLNYFGIQEQYNVATVLPHVLYKKDWTKTTGLLVIPGGRDLPYTKDLTGDALVNIREFISGGGSYLGLCAGAYFSCSRVVFEKGTRMEVIGPRDLNLFHGTAEGSVYHPFVYNSTRGSRTVPLHLENNVTKSFAYFNGGCSFLPDDGFTDYKTIATYTEYPSRRAIVSREVGEGRVILSGVHPEMDVRYLDSSQYSSKQWEEMEKHQAEQRNLLQTFVKFLLKLDSPISRM